MDISWNFTLGTESAPWVQDFYGDIKSLIHAACLQKNKPKKASDAVYMRVVCVILILLWALFIFMGLSKAGVTFLFVFICP